MRSRHLRCPALRSFELKLALPSGLSLRVEDNRPHSPACPTYPKFFEVADACLAKLPKGRSDKRACLWTVVFDPEAQTRREGELELETPMHWPPEAAALSLVGS